MKTCFLNKDKVKFLQIKQDAIRQRCNQKHEKKQCNCVGTHKAWHPLLPYAAVWPFHSPTVAYVLNWWPVSQPKTSKDIRILYSLKYKHLKKNIYEKLNSSVRWNQNLGKQHYRIFSNKRWVTNKPRPLISAASYLHWNKRLPLISAFPLINAATLSAGIIRIVTIFTSS